MIQLRRIGWLRWLVVRLAVAGAVYAVTYTLLNYHLTEAAAREAEALRQEGFPVSAADLQRKQVPVVDDAGPLWRAAAELNNVLEAELQAAADKDENLSAGLVRLRGGKFEFVSNDVDRDPTSQDLDRMRDLVRANGAMLGLLRDAAGKPGFNSEVDYSKGPATLLPDLQPARAMAGFCRMAAELSADQGNYRAAAEYLTSMHALTRWMGDEPVLICLLVRVSIEQMMCESIHEIIETCDVPEAELAGLQALVAEDPQNRGRCVRSVVGESILLTETMNLILDGRVAEVVYDAGNRAGLTGLPRLWIVANLAEGLRFWHKQTEEVQQSQWPLVPLESHLHPAKDIPSYAALARMLAPNLEVVYAKVNEHEARRRVTALGIGLIRHKRAAGSYPENLGVLGRELSRAAGGTSDPTMKTNTPLVYRREGDGFVLYSRGRNGTDDGGRWENDSSARQSADDIVFRVSK